MTQIRQLIRSSTLIIEAVSTTFRALALLFLAWASMASTLALGQNNITINKQVLTPTLIAGQFVTFQIDVENNTGGAQTSVTVSDTLPSAFLASSITLTQITNTTGSTITYSPAGTNPATASIPNFASGGKLTFQVKARLNSNAAGSYSNTATVTGYPSSTLNFGVTAAPPPVVTITKTQSTASFALTPATPITYTVNVKNTSTTDAVGYSFADVLYANANSGTAPSVTFTVNAGASCSAVGASPACPALFPAVAPASVTSGSTLFSTATGIIPAGANWNLTYTVTPTAITGGCGFTGVSLQNTATIRPTNQQSQQFSNSLAQTSTACKVNPPDVYLDVGVTKTGVLSTIAGVPTITYTMKVTNYSGMDLSNKIWVTDSLTSSGTGLYGTLDRTGRSLTCTASAGASCPVVTAATSPINIVGTAYEYPLNSATLTSFPSNATLTFTLVVPVKLSAQCGPNQINIDNTFYALAKDSGFTTYQSGQTHPYYATAPQQTVAIPQNPCVDLVAEKTITNTSFKPGDPIQFTVTLYNVSTSGAANVPFEDLLPSGFVYTSSSCAANGTASCGGTPTFTSAGNKLTLNVASLPANGSKASGSVTITINGTASTLATDFGAKRNEIAIPTSPANGGYIDTNPGSNTTSVNYNVRGKAELSLTKTGECNVAHTANSPATYTVTVKNNGPDAAINAVLKDPAVLNLTVSGSTCTASTSPLGVCPTGTSAALVTALQSAAGLTIPSLANGASVTFTLTGTYGAEVAPVNNVATVSLPTSAYEAETVLGNNSDSCQSATLTAPLTISKTIAGADAGRQGAVIISVLCGKTSYGPYTLPASSAAGTYPMATIPNLPVGAACTVTETATGVISGSTVSTTYTTSATGATVNSGTVATGTVTIGAVAANVTFTNTYPEAVGALTITKTIGGPAAGQQGTVNVSAVCGGVTYGPYTLGAGATGTTTMATLTGIPRGVNCNVSETSNGGNANLSVTSSYAVNFPNAPSTSGTGSSASATIALNQTGTVALTNNYQNLLGSLTVQKIIAGDGAGMQGAIQFDVQCGTTKYGAYTIPAGATGSRAVTTLNNLPAGVACSVVEISAIDPTLTSTTSVTLNGGPATQTLSTSATISTNTTQQVVFTNTYTKPIDVVVSGGTDTGTGTCNAKDIVLSGTRIDFVPLGGGATISTTTDAAGAFSVNLSSGSYTMTTFPTAPGISGTTQTIFVPLGAVFNVSAVLVGSPCAVPATDYRVLMLLCVLLAGLGAALSRRTRTARNA
jgi:uncharacterized repeat protein (TIGR01451 family)